ncbi:MAG: site-2 protease family protein [Candidatus Eremiobacteraeota bacterium]|nr:site-2 protease family protein [Candidatus Eremiobacteraeota bacterium]
MRVGRIFGIDIYIDPSWILIFVVVAWMLSSDAGPLRSAGLSTPERWLFGSLTALLFFASVLAHELAHSLVARMRGLNVSRITLFIFGGISQLTGDFKSATGEGWVAFVGPLCSAVLAALFYVASQALGAHSALGLSTGYLWQANAALAVFNLLPAYPLDGGKVFHSLIWQATGDRRRATQIASAVGQSIAIVMIALGIFLAFTWSFINGLWLAFIGWFLFQAGRAEAYQSSLGAALGGQTASTVATMPPPPFRPDTTASDATQALLRSGQRAAAVVSDGRLLGIVTLSDLARVHVNAPGVQVSSLMTPVDKIKSVAPDSDALQALNLLAQTGFHQLPVVDQAGGITGFVTREGVLQRLALSN